VTPATARTILLYLLIVWVGVLFAGLLRRGVGRLRREGRGGAGRGGLEVAGGLAGLALVAWLLW
jgi:hypothetical protein